MKKIIMVAIATAAAITYLVMRRKTAKSIYQPVIKATGNTEKHLTNVFSRAKEHGM